MREILFRGQRIDNGEWVYGQYLKREYSGFTDYSVWTPKGTIPVKPESIGQFTGLLDKSGNEIFIGDRVKDDYGRIMEVVFWNYRYCFYAITKTNFRIADFYEWLPNSFRYNGENTFPITKLEIEIIGNIHENGDK